MQEIIRRKLFWDGLRMVVNVFVQNCLYCIITRTGKHISRPLSIVLRREWANEIVHMDSSYMGNGTESDMDYILILKNGLTSYFYLHLDSSRYSEADTKSLNKWIAAFGSMDWLVSDRVPYFTASIFSDLIEEARDNHQITTAHYP